MRAHDTTHQGTTAPRTAANKAAAKPDDPSRHHVGLVRDDLAYFLPMAVFLGFTFVGGHWKSLFPLSYVAKVVVVGAMLVAFRKLYTRIRWDYWWLGIIVGVLGVFQWVPMQLWLQRFEFFTPPEPKDVFDPFRVPTSGHLAFGHGAHRCIGAELARMELRTVLPRLFQRFPDLALAVPESDLAFRQLSFVYGVDELPVTF